MAGTAGRRRSLALSAGVAAATLSAAVAVALVVAPSTLADPPGPSGWNMPSSPVIFEATSAAGAPIALNVSVSDPLNDLAGPPTCPTSLGLGTWTVTCTVDDAGDGQTYTSPPITVSVQDTTPPTITASNVSVPATSPAGALVPNPATAWDAVDGSFIPSCSSFGLSATAQFPIGVTTVNCTAQDAAGNSSSASFTVTVTVPSPPVISGVPSPLTVEADAPGGGHIPSYTLPTAMDAFGVSVPVNCPPPGTPEPLGMNTVTCSATDAYGDTTTTSFTVDVVDTTPPTLTVPLNMVVEATSPSGAVVTFTARASDIADPSPDILCSPASQSQFGFGTTTVNCTAKDASGNHSTGSFTVTVRDTTPPAISVPSNITADATGGSGASVTYTVTASDLVAGPVTASCGPIASGGTFPIGITTITCMATDAVGNRSSASFTVTVNAPTQPNAPPPPPPPPPVDRTPPGDVGGVTAAIGAGNRIILGWTAPSASDFDHVVIVRGDPSGAGNTTVYTGNATSFVDVSVVAGTEYRYVITAYDHAGNASAGVALLVKPSPAALTSPLAGARVAHAPLLAWAARPGTTYYNVQLYRGTTKVLSLWPAAPHVQLPKKWKFGSHRYTLNAGTYTWYVWPGVGPRSAKRYGAVLGQSTFVVG